jgi:hypothetical protein
MVATKHRENWLSPMNRIRWIRAFRTRAMRVTLRDGRRFSIRYTSQNIGVSGESVKVAVVSPADGSFFPSGNFRLSKVVNRDWVTEASREDNPPGLYLRCLDEFIQNDDLQGVRVDDYWPDLIDKVQATLRRGFANAKTTRGKRAEHVKVVTDKGKVFLVKDV